MEIENYSKFRNYVYGIIELTLARLEYFKYW